MALRDLFKDREPEPEFTASELAAPLRLGQLSAEESLAAGEKFTAYQPIRNLTERKPENESAIQAATQAQRTAADASERLEREQRRLAARGLEAPRPVSELAAESARDFASWAATQPQPLPDFAIRAFRSGVGSAFNYRSEAFQGNGDLTKHLAARSEQVLAVEPRAAEIGPASIGFRALSPRASAWLSEKLGLEVAERHHGRITRGLTPEASQALVDCSPPLTWDQLIAEDWKAAKEMVVGLETFPSKEFIRARLTLRAYGGLLDEALGQALEHSHEQALSLEANSVADKPILGGLEQAARLPEVEPSLESPSPQL
jgi:hypothetical protein